MSNLKILFNDRNIYVKSRFNFDVSYQAVLNYAIVQGHTLPSSAQRIKQNNLVVSLKNANYWNRFDSLAQFSTDGDTNFALIDWKRLSQMTAINSPIFTTNQGFKTNGTSSYINTNFNPSLNGVNYTQNSAGISANTFSLSSSNRYVVGTLSTADGAARIRATTSNAEYQMNGSIVSNASGINSNIIGNVHMDRLSSNQIVMQAENILGNLATNTSTGVPINDLWINRIVNVYNDSGVRYFIARNAFTESEKNNLNTIFNNYFNSL